MAHFAFLTFDSPGHVAGIVNLADKMIQTNPSITGTVYIVTTLEGRWGTTNISSEPLPGLNAVKLPLEPDGDNINAPFTYSLQQPEKLANDVVAAIQKDLAGKKLTASVCDHYGSTWAGSAARAMNIPSYIYMPTPILMWSVLRELPRLKDFNQHGILTVPHYGDLGHLQLPQMGDMIGPLANQCELAKLHDGMIVNDQKEIYGQEYTASLLSTIRRIWFIGYLPTAVPTQQEIDAPTISWLNKQSPRSVIYIAMGSVANLCKADQVELAKALEYLGKPVLWVVRKPNNKSDPYRPMHAPEDYQEPPCTEECDDRGFPEGWVKRMGDKALIIEWAPQPTVLSHASVGLFISHCGWNSLTECITLAGVPIIGLPMLTDQPMNADIMEHKLHIGKNLWKSAAEGRIDYLTAATTIEQVMTNKELIYNAERLKRQNMERWLPSGSSTQQLREIIA